MLNMRLTKQGKFTRSLSIWITIKDIPALELKRMYPQVWINILDTMKARGVDPKSTVELKSIAHRDMNVQGTAPQFPKKKI